MWSGLPWWDFCCWHRWWRCRRWSGNACPSLPSWSLTTRVSQGGEAQGKHDASGCGARKAHEQPRSGQSAHRPSRDPGAREPLKLYPHHSCAACPDRAKPRCAPQRQAAAGCWSRRQRGGPPACGRGSGAKMPFVLPILLAGVLRSTELPYARPTAVSMRAMSVGSRTPRASAVMHSRSSVRFFTPKTTVATPTMDSA